MLATQAMRALSVLLQEGSPSFDRRRYLQSEAGGVVQAYSRSSVQLGVDAPPVAAFMAAEARTVLRDRPELSADERVSRRLATAALLRFMTSHESPRRWLIRPDDDALLAYCADAGLEAHVADPDAPDGAMPSAPDAVEPVPGVLIAIDCPLGAVLRSIGALGPARKGIALAPATSPDIRAAFRQLLPGHADEIETGVDLGSGPATAWVWSGP